MKIYTKTGDKGTTRLVDGSTVEKSDARVEAYGTVDELNSWIGEARSRLLVNESIRSMDEQLEQIQSHLFNLGSRLACQKKETLKMLPSIEPSHIESLEVQMDQWDSELPELKNFILPAGHSAACALHLARTVCRRAERKATRIPQGESHDPNELIYLNRLSDFLFLAARWVNFKTGTQEVIWKKS